MHKLPDNQEVRKERPPERARSQRKNGLAAHDAEEVIRLFAQLAEGYDEPVDRAEYSAGIAAAYGLAQSPRSRLLGFAQGLRLSMLHSSTSAAAEGVCR